MASDLRRRSVAELIASGTLFIGDGYRAKNEELGIHGLPFARAGNINNGFNFEDADCFPIEKLHKIGNKTSRPGDVVFTSKGTVGRFAFVTDTIQPFVYSPQLCFWRSLDENSIDPRYLYYWMIGPEFFLQYNLVKGQTDMADYVSLTDQRRMFITLPSREEQRAIADILGSLDDKIELNRRMNATLEETAQALFKSWFVDFDPVRAKMEGREPVGMDAETAALFPDRLVESELGLIPEGWAVGQLDEMLVLQRGFDLPAPERTVGEYPILAASGPSGTHNEYKVEGPGVTTGRSGVLGRVFFVHENFWPLNTSLWIKEFKAARPIYAYHLLCTIDLGAFNAGSAVPTLNRNHIHNLPVVLPPMSIVERFEQFVKPLFQHIKANELETLTVATVRDALLPKLLSGEVRVENTAIRINDDD